MAKFSGRKETKGRRERGARTRKREKEEEEEVRSRVIVLSVCGGTSSCVW